MKKEMKLRIDIDMDLSFFEIKSVNFYSNNTRDICSFCKKEIKSHSVVLIECEHLLCTNCLDLLSDSYFSYSSSSLLECPTCNKKIFNINYK